MATFQVFVVGPADASARGMEALAQAMAARYGLQASDLVARMTAGRFRVKSGLDRATADVYARELQKLGALTAVEEGRGTQESTPVPVSSVPSIAAVRSGSSSLPPPVTTAARTSSSSLPPPVASRTSTAPFASGLSAAFSGEVQAASLGALDSSVLSLSSLDGSDGDEPAPVAAPHGAPAVIAASFGPPVEKPVTVPPPTKPAAVISDRFAPPDQEAAELSVELHADELADRARRRTSMPPATTTTTPLPAAPAPATPPLRPLARSTPAGGTVAPDAMAVIAAPPRWRLPAGVAIAIVLGFIPAHFVGAMRENAKYGAIDRDIAAAQAAAITPADYDALDDLRSGALDRKRDARTMIILTSLLVWAAAGGAIGYVWSRKLPA